MIISLFFSAFFSFLFGVRVVPFAARSVVIKSFSKSRSNTSVVND